MRSILIRFVLCLIPAAGAGVAHGDVVSLGTVLEGTYTIFANGRNSTGTYPDSESKETGKFPLQDNVFLPVLDSVQVTTDSGYGTLSIAGFASHTDKKNLLGAHIEGGASLGRVPFGEGGAVNVGGGLTMSYTDFMGFSAPAQTSGPLLIQGFVKLHGSMDASSTTTGSLTGGSASAYVTLEGSGIDNPNVPYLDIFQNAGQPKQSVSNAWDSNVVPFAFLTDPYWGYRLEFHLSVGGNAAVSSARYVDAGIGTASSVFNASFENTLEWGGITSVTDADTGEPITDWSVTSESGFDYSQVYPAPLPSSVILLVSGMGVLWVLLWSRQSRALSVEKGGKLRILPLPGEYLAVDVLHTRSGSGATPAHDRSQRLAHRQPLSRSVGDECGIPDTCLVSANDRSWPI